MRYPSMGSNPRNAVSVPSLSGGVNLGDALNLVDDNQLTDCKNVWYKDGMLQTRPGIVAMYDSQSSTPSEMVDIAKVLNYTITIDDIEYKLAVSLDPQKTNMHIKGLSATKNSEQQYHSFTMNVLFAAPIKSYVFYNGKPTKTNGKGVYMITTLENETVELYELWNNGGYRFELFEADELYVPTVYINGKPMGYETISDSIAPASFFEGYSAFTGAWARFCFTTSKDLLMYKMPVDIDNSLFKIEYTTLEGDTYYSIIYRIENGTLKALKEDGNLDVENAINDNGFGRIGNGKLYFDVSAKGNNFTFLDSSGSMTEDYLTDAIGKITNNLQITIKPLSPTKSLLAGATTSNEFGGMSEGIFGGTRTFLSGFSGENKNLLMWSDVNNPTYFSENNYRYVGSKGQKITALAKQDDMLVIFKEKEIFYTVYSEGSSYTAEDVISGKVLDVSTLDATFPLVQISEGVGCNFPDTIKLCGNRLVWANSDNKVYMLRSANQYNPVNISVISQMLGKVKFTEGMTATTYVGFYLLKSGNKVYLLNYDQYYFNALPSYSDSKKANRKMQWFVWELPSIISSSYGETTSGFISDAENLLLFVFLKGYDQVDSRYKNRAYIWEFKEDALDDTVYNSPNATQMQVPIETVIQTKMFDFGAMERFKSIEQLYVEFGKANGEINLQYITERGRINDTLAKLNYEELEDVTKFIKTKRFLPSIKRALKFGLRITAKGKVALGGILIKFKYMGVTR